MHHHKATVRQSHTVFARTIIACAVGHLLLGSTIASGLLLSQPVYAQAAAKQYNIPAGTLEDALNQFGRASGILLSFAASQTAGLTTQGLQGSYTVQSGLNTLLDNTGLEALRQANGSYLLSKVTSKDSALPVVTVQAVSSATTEGTRSYAASAVTLGKAEQSLKDIPQSVSVVTRQQLDDQAVTGLREAANSVTGVVGAQGVGAGVVLSARGFQIDNWQYDGVSFPRNMYSLGNWGNDDMVFYDRMEVLRGASGLFEGTGSPGGAVNLVRKRGQAVPTVSLTAKAGSWSHYGLQLDAGGPLNKDGSLRGRIVLDEDRSHSFIDSVWYKTRSMYAALDYDISASTTIGIAVSNKNGTSRPMFVGLPRYAAGVDIGLDRSTFTGAWWNRAKIDQTTVYADLTHRFNSRWSMKASVISLEEKNTSVHQRMAGVVAADGSGVNYGDFATDFDSSKKAADIYVRGAFDAFSLSHELVVGANYSRYTSNDKFALAWQTGGNIFAINHDRTWQDFASIAARGTTTPSQYEVEQKGVYASLNTKLTDHLTVVAGARTSWYDYLYHNLTTNSRSIYTASGNVTPYAGLIYALNNQWSVYGSYTGIFQPQSSRTAQGTLLDPVQGVNYEAGIKGELMDGRVNTSFAVFRYDHKNRADTDYASGMVCNGSYCSIASGKVRSQGLEAEVSGEVASGLQVIAGYTFNTTKFLEDSANKGKVFSTWTPKHMLRLWANYKLPGTFEKLSVGGGVSTQTNTLGYDRSFEVPGFTLVNARVGYQVTPEVTLALNINNLLDRRYYVPGYNAINGNNNYGDPRNFMLTLRYTPKF